ncbi:hypothetical protein [Peribacillus loiseleuriae]|uniref:hypothetical protein n=1 Tax=Peribacillus loiseleuriae TaxID=1679170 RepID=UPI003D028B86
MNKPTIKGLGQLDVAVLTEKMIVINGMLQYGTPEEKKRAKESLQSIQNTILASVNQEAFNQARYELKLSTDDLNFTDTARIFSANS